MKRKISSIAILLLILLTVLAYRFSLFTRLASVLPSRSSTARVGGDVVAPKVPFLSSSEQEIIREINLARTNPREYASYLEDLKARFKGNNYQRANGMIITTSEGIRAVDEAIKFLRSVKPVSPLDVSKGMSLGAKEHVNDLGPKGGVGHKGTDASLVEERVNHFGSYHDAIGETIAYDKGTARDIVTGFIVDDGLPSRSHRQTIFNSDYHIAGVNCGDHKTLGTMCVVTYAGGFMEGASGTSLKPVATRF